MLRSKTETYSLFLIDSGRREMLLLPDAGDKKGLYGFTIGQTSVRYRKQIRRDFVSGKKPQEEKRGGGVFF